MNLEDYKKMLEAIQFYIQCRKNRIEHENFQSFNFMTEHSQITIDYMKDLLELNEYRRTEKKLIEKIKSLEEIKRLEEECKKSPLPNVKWSDLNKMKTFLNNSICSSHAVIEEVEDES